jgi:phosphoadenosine phosphosulfate reductase
MCVINRALENGIREVVVAVSGGKDSIVTLDMCLKHFDRVDAFHLHIVKDLSWEEKSLQWCERFYGIKIRRFPHPVLSRLYREATFRHGTNQATKMPVLKPAELDNAIRSMTGIRWFARGERTQDSLERKAYITETGGIDRLDDEWQRNRDDEFERQHGRRKSEKRSRYIVWPIGFWREQDVLSYMQQHRLPIPAMFSFASDEFFQQRGKKARREFGGFQLDTVAFIRERFPDDYEKIRKAFPLIEAQFVRWQIFKRRHDEELERAKNEVPEVRKANHPA